MIMRAALPRRAAVGVAAARRSIWGMSAQPTGDTLTLPMDIPCPAPLFDGATDTQVSTAPALATSPPPASRARLLWCAACACVLTAAALWRGLASGHYLGERPQGGVV